jgi:hypothetical protein
VTANECCNGHDVGPCPPLAPRTRLTRRGTGPVTVDSRLDATAIGVPRATLLCVVARRFRWFALSARTGMPPPCRPQLVAEEGEAHESEVPGPVERGDLATLG